MIFRLLVLCLVVASSAFGQGAPDVFARARRMVNDGDAKAGRVLVDSALAAAAPNSAAYAEALYWRGVLGEDGDAARTDLLRVAIEFPFSPRASDALLRLAQGEFTRGDRVAALRHLDQLAREHPDAPSRAAGKYWTARILLEDAKPAEACTALREAQRAAPASDVELANQIAYYARSCDAVESDDAARKSAEKAKADSIVADSAKAAAARTSKETARPSTKGKWSVQVAAYGDHDAALALVRKLKARGFEARVTAEKPWRVRVGHYGTRADAAEVAQRLSGKGSKAMVVEAEAK
jgi:cell division septation protein DedD